MNNRILASGPVYLSSQIVVKLVEPDDEPPRIVIDWPNAVSVTTPRKLPDVVNAANAVLRKAMSQLEMINREKAAAERKRART